MLREAGSAQSLGKLLEQDPTAMAFNPWECLWPPRPRPDPSPRSRTATSQVGTAQVTQGPGSEDLMRGRGPAP